MKESLQNLKTVLGKIAEISSGGTPARGVPEYWNGNIPWVKTTQIQNCQIFLESVDEWITQNGLKNSSAKIIPAGTILMAMYGQGKTRGQVGILAFDAAINQACAAIELKGNVDRDFIFQSLLANYKKIRAISNVGGQENLSAGLIKEIPIYLPKLTEQKAIADLLSTWDKAIEKTERLIQAKEKRFKWLLRELIFEAQKVQKNTEWKKLKLGEICKLYQPQTISKEDMCQTGPFKVFGANGVIGFYEKYNHEEPEIAITCRGATCGTINITEPKSWITGNAMIAQPNEKKMLKNFLYYSLLVANMKSVISGAAQPQITRQDLAPLNVLVPPLESQKQIAETLSFSQNEIDLLKQLAEKYKTQKRGLMQKLLTGQWRLKSEIINRFKE